ncbi:hypothetical protein A0257_21045 [Hymenobacter psoromatis]|nr:hypothetical protein A0257_21045 [Hymenobacter psoromatis]
MLTLPQRLRALRQERGLTQTQVGEALGVGKMTVSQLETGRQAVAPAKLAKLAQFYGLSVGDLCAFEPAPAAAQAAREEEHLRARLAAAERALREQDQVLVEMRGFFTELDRLVGRNALAAAPLASQFARFGEVLTAAVTEGLSPAGTRAATGRAARGKQMAHPTAPAEEDEVAQMLQLVLRGVRLRALLNLPLPGAAPPTG